MQYGKGMAAGALYAAVPWQCQTHITNQGMMVDLASSRTLLRYALIFHLTNAIINMILAVRKKKKK